MKMMNHTLQESVVRRAHLLLYFWFDSFLYR